MASPYKSAHDKLIAAIGTAADYDTTWQAIAGDLSKLVVGSGFSPQGKKVPAQIREKLMTAATEAGGLRTGAKAPATDAGPTADASKKRALGLKTLRHLYFHETFGKQKVWILSLPVALRGYPMDYSDKGQPVIDAVLAADNEKFSETTRKDLAEASQTGLAWVHRAMMVAGAPLELGHRKLFRRWFVPAGTAKEDEKITTLAGTMRPHLQSIANGLKAGEMILTDSPHERATDSSLEKSEAFVFTRDDLITVHVESTFFSPNNTLTGKTNWARILVHELSHAYAKTEDHAYSWQGLLPRDTDLLKKGIDARLLANPGWSAVRTLSAAQCAENADSWAFFIADCAGALTDTDRMQALGQRIYDRASETLERPLADQLKTRAGVT